MSTLYFKYKNSIKDDYSILLNAQKGVQATVFFDFANFSGISKHKLADDVFQVSLKTLTRHKIKEISLSPRNSELLLKLIALFKKGEEVFGSNDSFLKWLDKPAFGIGNTIPFQILNTTTGIDLIYEELLRIEHGAVA